MDLVRRIDVIDSSHCRLWFDADHNIELNGEAMKTLFEHLERFHILKPLKPQ